MARGYYEPKLLSANQALCMMTSAKTQMKASVENKNKAIEGLQEAARQREVVVAAAQMQARAKSDQKQLQAKVVMQTKLPEGVDQCAAAHYESELEAAIMACQ